MEKIYIYGTGMGARRIYEKVRMSNNILGFIDSNEDKRGEEFLGFKVYAPRDIISTDYEKIFIANVYKETYYKLKGLGIQDEKIVICYRECMTDLLQDQSRSLKKMLLNEEGIEDIYTMKMSYNTKDSEVEGMYEAYNDYARYKTLELLCEQIHMEKLKGNVAEVGVYRGDFAKVINKLFKNRKLYLFDTFEGFSEAEKNFDIMNSYSKESTLEQFNFKDTNIEKVLQNMPYKEQCIIKKGLFPETAKDVDENFAFVSIDVDLYKPLYNALEYFYPRLVENGYIMMHDYNHKEFKGAKEAIRDYESIYGKLKKVPLCDQGGTLIITK